MRKLCAGCKKWTVSFDFDGRFGYNGMRSDVAARGRVLPHSADAEIVRASPQRCAKKIPAAAICDREILAGETRFEHATYGFGDRYSTIEPLP